MGINKVKYGDTTLIDITDTTAEAKDVASGKYFYGKDGVKTTGTAQSTTWTLLGSGEVQANTTSTTASKLTDINITDVNTMMSKDKIILVRIRDKAGRRNGYFFSTENYFENGNTANAGTGQLGNGSPGLRYIYTVNNNTLTIATQTSTNGYGVYCYGLYKEGYVRIYARYHSSNSRTINGTYTVEVYAIDFPKGINPFGV